MEFHSALAGGSREAAGQDWMEYAVFPDSLHGAEDADAHAALEPLRLACLGAAAVHTQGYTWQKEGFRLSAVRRGAEGGGWREVDERDEEERGYADGLLSQGRQRSTRAVDLPHLYGKTLIGDNVEDEWFITWILLEISKQLPHLSIAVRDSDGQFLLIEAAFALPKWLDPASSRNRVFIRQGTVRIIPKPSSSIEFSSIPSCPSLAEALQIVRTATINTIANSRIQSAIQRRVAGYPERARESMHTARCRVPIRVAQILRYEPQLVALAVDAFYLRDVDDMKAAVKMAKFFPSVPLSTGEGLRENDRRLGRERTMVDVMVQFNRAMYAQLSQQSFHPPKGYPMPLPSEKSFRAAELGMKLACGFEILYSKKEMFEDSEEAEGDSDRQRGTGTADETRDMREARERMEPIGTGVREDEGNGRKVFKFPVGDPGWERFRSNLERTGYFRGLLEGSVDHRKLMRTALEMYHKTETFVHVSKAVRAPFQRIDEILSMEASVEDYPTSNLRESDDDRWLYTGEEDLTREMVERQKEMEDYEAKRAKQKAQNNDVGGRKTLTPEKREMRDEGEEENEVEFDPAEVVKSMRAFVDKMSSFEGAEVPRSNDKNEATSNCDSPIAFDVKRFMQHLEEATGVSARSQISDNESEMSISDSEDEWNTIRSDETDDELSDWKETGAPAMMNTTPQKDLRRGESSMPERGWQSHSNASGGKISSSKVGRMEALGQRNRLTLDEVPEPSGSAPVTWGVKGSKGGDILRKSEAGGTMHALNQQSAGEVGKKGKNAVIESEDEFKGEYGDEDEDGSAFMEAYSEAMDSELGTSTLVKSFERAEVGESFEDTCSAKGKKKAETIKEKAGLRPIDVDMNLMKSLLESYSSQQGLPGPASNLLGAMGLQLPQDNGSLGKQKQTASEHQNKKPKGILSKAQGSEVHGDVKGKASGKDEQSAGREGGSGSASAKDVQTGLAEGHKLKRGLRPGFLL